MAVCRKLFKQTLRTLLRKMLKPLTMTEDAVLTFGSIYTLYMV